MTIKYPLDPLPPEPRPLQIPALKPGFTAVPGLYTYALDKNYQLQHYHARQGFWYEFPFYREWQGSKIYRLNFNGVRHHVSMHLIWAHTYLPCPIDPAHVFVAPHPYHLNSLNDLKWVDAERAPAKAKVTKTRTCVYVPEILALIVPATPGTLAGPRFPCQAKVKLDLPKGFTAASYNTALLQNAALAPKDHPDYDRLQSWIAEHYLR